MVTICNIGEKRQLNRSKKGREKLFIVGTPGRFFLVARTESRELKVENSGLPDGQEYSMIRNFKLKENVLVTKLSPSK